MQPATDPGLTEKARNLLRNLSETSLSQSIIVCWNARMRSAAGRAWLQEKRIDINPMLQALSAAEVERTLRHELAHLLAQHRAGRKPIQAHGKEWQDACAELGIPGEKATHQLPLPSRRQSRKYAYQCRSCGHIVERVRKIIGPTACGSCCRTKNQGRFSEDFILEKLSFFLPSDPS